MLGTSKRFKLIKEMPRPKCGPGGSWTPPSPNCHLVHDPQMKSTSLTLFLHICDGLPPGPPKRAFARINNFSQAYRLAFVTNNQTSKKTKNNKNNTQRKIDPNRHGPVHWTGFAIQSYRKVTNPKCRRSQQKQQQKQNQTQPNNQNNQTKQPAVGQSLRTRRRWQVWWHVITRVMATKSTSSGTTKQHQAIPRSMTTLRLMC